MGKLIYSTNASLDGYIAEPGKSDWAMPDEEVHAFEEVSSEADIAIGGLELLDERRFGNGGVALHDRLSV